MATQIASSGTIQTGQKKQSGYSTQPLYKKEEIRKKKRDAYHKKKNSLLTTCTKDPQGT